VTVTLRAALSCGIVIVEHTIHMDDRSDQCNVWISSAFTPNNDGVNDTWTWKSACGAVDFAVDVFDRWGELVFSTNDPQAGWDGTYKGILLTPGLYSYRVGYRQS
jgi:gliding motility-associated-like protein